MKICFQPNYLKILESVMWTINTHRGITIYHLLKVLFHADWLSVNKYGIPVTGETYHAFQFGTVPLNTYRGLINKDPLYLEFFGLDIIPIEVRDKHCLYPQRLADEKQLSETDKECLLEGIKGYAFLDFKQVLSKNHTHEGWRKTYKLAPESAIDWFDLIENKKLREELVETAEYLVI